MPLCGHVAVGINRERRARRAAALNRFLEPVSASRYDAGAKAGGLASQVPPRPWTPFQAGSNALTSLSGADPTPGDEARSGALGELV